MVIYQPSDSAAGPNCPFLGISSVLLMENISLCHHSIILMLTAYSTTCTLFCPWAHSWSSWHKTAGLCASGSSNDHPALSGKHRNQLTISVTCFPLCNYSALLPQADEWGLVPYRCSVMTSDNIPAHFHSSKPAKSISCLTRTRDLKRHHPLLFPSPDMTSSGLGLG